MVYGLQFMVRVYRLQQGALHEQEVDGGAAAAVRRLVQRRVPVVVLHLHLRPALAWREHMGGL